MGENGPLLLVDRDDDEARVRGGDARRVASPSRDIDTAHVAIPDTLNTVGAMSPTVACNCHPIAAGEQAKIRRGLKKRAGGASAGPPPRGCGTPLRPLPQHDSPRAAPAAN